MPTFDLDENRANFQIHGFKPGTIKINEKILTKSVIVTPYQLIEQWAPQTFSELSFASFMPIIELKPDILLLGTGSKMELVDPAIYCELINRGIGIEIMDTSAACRTYNALSAENRNVVAALIIR